MITLEVEPNANCEPVELRVFEDLEPPRRVTHVRLERTPGRPEWHALVGWTSAGTACPAFAQKVSDSGDGTALLVRSGGDAGLRLRAEHDHSTWRLDDPAQWGEPFLLLADEADLRVAKEKRWP